MKQAALVKQIVNSFNLSELRMLCLQLNIDYEDLAGATLTDKSIALVERCRRHHKLEAWRIPRNLVR